MRYASAKEIAAAWGVSERSVRNYCAQGRIEGAFLTGKTWNIPFDAAKPPRANARAGAASASDAATRIHNPLLDHLREEREARVKGGIYHKLQVELTYNSNRIEGSRLSLDQTRLIFETSTIAECDTPLPVDDIVETANHFRCIDYVIDHAERAVTTSLIKELHRMLKSSTSDAARPWFAVGDWKQLPNEVGGMPTTPPEQVEAEIRRLVAEHDGCIASASGARSLDDLLDFHVHFERIHPFQDGNGRVGRLLLLKECLASGRTPIVIADDMKMYYYRGIARWNEERGYLRDTCLAAQDRVEEWLRYFRI